MSNTGTILDKIVEAKRLDLEKVRVLTPSSELESRVSSRPPPRSLDAVLKKPGVGLIAEVKKASPSRGLLSANFDPVALARTYAKNGAVAISVLTETPHFQGRLEDLQSIREALGPDCPPLLRKDFIFDEYQVLEARAWGADAILLITSILEEDELKRLLREARALGMDSLIEAHTRGEIGVALAAGAAIIGINNRDLATFRVDLETTHCLRPLVPQGRTVVAESGIFTGEDVARVAAWGVDAVLVGESLVKSPDAGVKVRELATATLQKVPDD